MPTIEVTTPAPSRIKPHATRTPDRIVHGVNIDREWRLTQEVVPAMTACPRLRRTAYFYRREALAWLRHMRRGWLLTPADCKELALGYLASYRRAKGGGL